VPTRVGKKKKRMKGPEAANKLPLGEFFTPVEQTLCGNSKNLK